MCERGLGFDRLRLARRVPVPNSALQPSDTQTLVWS